MSKCLYVNLDNISSIDIDLIKNEVVVYFPSGNWKRHSIEGKEILVSKGNEISETMDNIFINKK